MIWLAAAALAVTALAVLACAEVVRSLVRSQARERALLLDRLMHLAGHTWSPPPAETWTMPEPSVDPDEGRFVTSPEQLPEHDWDEEL